ncbi:TetR/AcrR family transcriptional regulator C-terminal domain-containing protein [Paenibacillus sp. GCM10023248]|uniref:TetR/AcrR family transcriptional regulator C-terminal domain-containing protein n=1 Tax=unclassified Paenibacillus TaxID=185978 RepID=UPI002379D67C|nr:TetR/AcrR family transcriptional regulator C-terminal domain-containing protein [Paenibacillus sp. MAHUQ-63]MDD9268013.1 TetR/AcrR family transcriptional regulator C-terminal domain-containing protein [Paenibacillus sp. MAHUQ-63]
MGRRRIQSAQTGTSSEADGQLHTPLDKERIIRHALEQLNALGLKELSMRKIADSLGVKAASLYYHVKDKDELLQLLGDYISDQLAWPEGDMNWKERIIGWAINFRTALLSYRDSVDIFNGTIATSYGRLRHIETLYGVLAEAGFQDKHIPWLAGMLKNYITSFAAEEARHIDMARSVEGPPEAFGSAYLAVFRSLPAEQFPHMIRLAAYTTGPDEEKEFLYGLGVLLDGFSAQFSNPH